MEGLQRTKSITLEGSSVGVGEDSAVVPMSRVGQGCLQVLCALCADQRHSGEGGGVSMPCLGSLQISTSSWVEGTPFLVLVAWRKVPEVSTAKV